LNKKPLLIATHNQGKLIETKDLLKNSSFDIVSLAQQEKSCVVQEDQSTFYLNALKKAQTYQQFYQMPVIADDSGLVVPALNGEPGVFSARFAHENASDEENNQFLLKKMKGIEDRRAYFECVVVYIQSPQNFVWARGTYNGEILEAPQGGQGFGYDPLFYVPTYKKTMAQLLMHEKNQISHRALALQKLLIKIKEKGWA